MTKNMINPLISVIVPVYNVESILRNVSKASSLNIMKILKFYL